MRKSVRIATVFLLLPLALGALETVNLAKNHSFEKEDDVWKTYTGTFQPTENDSAKANAHDSEAAFSGFFSASADTRSQPGDPTPPSVILDSAVVIQGFSFHRPLNDLDTLCWVMKVLPKNSEFYNFCVVRVSLIFDVGEDYWIWASYEYNNPKYSPSPDGPHRRFFAIDLPEDTNWGKWSRDLQEDLIDIKGLSPDAVLDSIAVLGYGFKDPNWLGQKVYWDDIRLMGYADYDVGVKEILSGDSLEVGTPYQPVARIKNFGRENADSFLVMAEVWDGSSLIYVDTLPWTLEGDTEDTVEFADFDPPTTGQYTLTIRTHMTPDECDEDDEVSKEIGHSSVSDSPLPDGLSLEVVGTSRGVLKVFFETPNGQVGNLSVYDATGRRIERMAVTRSGSVEFNSALASGVYLVRLESRQGSVTRKAILLR